MVKTFRLEMDIKFSAEDLHGALRKLSEHFRTLADNVYVGQPISAEFKGFRLVAVEDNAESKPHG